MRLHALRMLVACLMLAPGESNGETTESARTDVVAAWTETQLQVSNATDTECNVVVQLRMRRGAEDFYWTDELQLSAQATSTVDVDWPSLDLADSELRLPATISGFMILTRADGTSAGVGDVPTRLVNLSLATPTLHELTELVALLPSEVTKSMPPLAEDELLTGIDDPAVFGAVNDRPIAGAAAEPADPPNELEE
jgi:hypothetical protein